MIIESIKKRRRVFTNRILENRRSPDCIHSPYIHYRCFTDVPFHICDNWFTDVRLVNYLLSLSLNDPSGIHGARTGFLVIRN